MKKLSGALLFSLLASLCLAQEPRYISPNNDGVQDTLVIPFTVTDKRYVVEWHLLIADATGTVVRSIGNKQPIPERITVPVLLRLLTRPKQAVPIPSTVTWDGTFDDGSTAVDGEYTYWIEAADDNGNRNKSAPYRVIVDNTPPSITVTEPLPADKFFGAGAKTTVLIEQSGSREDRWVAQIRDAGERLVREYQWVDAPPSSVLWDGKGGTLIPVPDGVYSYSITATDRAGNVSLPMKISNILYSGDRPEPVVSIVGSRFFSPNGDNIQDTLTFGLDIPAPAQGNRLVNWALEIIGATGDPAMGAPLVQSLARFGGTSSPPSLLSFNGLDSRGAPLPEGAYRAVLTAEYLNGYRAADVASPLFYLDITPPKAALRMERDIFSPDGDGSLDTITVGQETSREAAWFGEVVSFAGTPVRRYDLGSRPGMSLAWDGFDDKGALCPNGLYTYRIYCDDEAGNHGEAVTAPFELNTGTTEVVLTAQPSSFSPNGDGVQDTVTFTPVIRSSGGVAEYRLTIRNSGGLEVRRFTGTRGLPLSLSWDGTDNTGTPLPDGPYSAALFVRSVNGSETLSTGPLLTIDRVFPAVTLTAPYRLFSPDSDGRKDTLPLTIQTSVEDRWTAEFFAAGGTTPLRTFTWRNQSAPSFDWDGTDEGGNILPDGTYRLALWAKDEAGNRSEAALDTIRIDTRAIRGYVTVEKEAFSPLAPLAANKKQTLGLGLTSPDGVDTWRLEILPVTAGVGSAAAAPPVRVWSGAASAEERETTGVAVPKTIDWDGRTTSGSLASGRYRAILTVEYAKGNRLVTEGAPFICSDTPPAVSVTVSPPYFSPDNDGVDDECHIDLRASSLLPFASWSFEIRDPEDGLTFWTTAGTTAITPRIVWDGRSNRGPADTVESAMDYPYAFTVTDTLGVSSKVTGKISVDVLVLREGNTLKMRVPAIIFRANHADFVGKDKDKQFGLSQLQIDTNLRVLRRVAEILNKFRDYSVTIEGHANDLGAGTNRQTALALSAARALEVRRYLVSFGVAASRLKTKGLGTTQPVVPLTDRANWWKNRRVEFILEK
jgi:outer membrane protein OmpA-like peptidoglycan-associated protein/flagellar hook assembly protein FlgD